MVAAEGVERQIAVAVVIAVEEPPLLVPVQGVVRGVQVEDDLLRWLGVRFQEQVHEQGLDGIGIVTDLVVARRPARGRMLEPVQRALARQRRR